MIGPLHNLSIGWVTFQHNFVAVAHMLETADPNMGQPSINTATVAVCEERFYTLLIDCLELRKLGHHRHYGLRCH